MWIKNILYSRLYEKEKSTRLFFYVLLLFIPLLLSVFTHLWNPVGFPIFHVDEGHYMRRAMQLLEGLGPQESIFTYDLGYDHPYFGQLFLASALKVIGFPDLLQPKVGDIHSIEMLYFIPRVLMGVLAVIDTFLVYKIAETRYNRKVAFIAATLFAVMPLSWLTRGVYLDSIQLPFLLLSILFAAYYAKRSESHYSDSSVHNERNKKIILLLLSGIFLGLAIFTKTPAFTMIPLILFVIIQKKKDGNKKISYDYSYDDNNNDSNNDKTDHHGKIIRYDNNSKNLKARISSLKPLGIWFIPVILIPLIWPVYAISQGQLDEWLDGIIYQTTRDEVGSLRDSIISIYEIDVVLVGLAAAGLIYATVKKDYFILLWAFPYLCLLYAIGWATQFHWIPVLPLVCIAPSILLETLKKIDHRKFGYMLEYAIISAVIFFGFSFTTGLITSSLNTQFIHLSSFLNQELANAENQEDNNEVLTMIGSHRTRGLTWIPIYVFDNDLFFRDTDIPGENFTKPIPTKKFVLVADSALLSRVNDENHIRDWIGDRRVAILYHNASETIATYLDIGNDKYGFMGVFENYGLGRFIEIKANY
jgi:Dolichyl-phosphate-mannose-protein mannosyltransferase